MQQGTVRWGRDERVPDGDMTQNRRRRGPGEAWTMSGRVDDERVGGAVEEEARRRERGGGERGGITPACRPSSSASGAA